MNRFAAASAVVGMGMTLAVTPALAQDSSASPPHQDGRQTTENAASAGVADIVVTAERRSQSLQRSSLAIQVLTSADLERTKPSQATDLNALVPGIQIATGGNAAQIYIRGVGDFAASALSNPAVAVNIDGVYVARPQAVNGLFYDIGRIEVLKGPQGTLYGRNASGGAINLITNRPSLSGASGFATVSIGNYDLKQLEAALNIPLGETLAIRGALNLLDRDGYLSDGTDDDQRQAGRLRLLWEPSQNFSLLLNADYTHEGGKGPGYVMLPRPAGTGSWTSAASPQGNAQLASTLPLGPVLPPVGNDTFRRNDFWNFSAEMNLELGFATLTVLPAYRDASLRERNYPAGLRNTIPRSRSKQSSVEVRLADDGQWLKWVIGGYAFRERQSAQQQVFQGHFQDTAGFYNPLTKSYAAFGQATATLTDTLRLIGGLRYTHERNTLTGQLFTNSPLSVPPGTPLPALLANFGGRKSFNAFTWKAGAEFDIGARNMLFATASTGFKAGGFNQTVAPDDTYDPEKITAFEIGSRNAFVGGRLILNFEGFYWKLRDAQAAHVKFDPLGNVNLITDNAGRSRSYGGNVELIAKVTDSDTLRGFAEYNNARYSDFSFDTAFSIFGSPVFNPASTGCSIGTPVAGSVFGTQIVRIDCSGRTVPRAPRWSGNASWAHDFALGNGGIVTATAALQFASARWLAFDYVANERVSGYASGDFDLLYTAPQKRWSIAAFVHNLTKKEIYTGGGEQAFAPPLVYATIAPPRTFGIRFRYNWGN
jgi:iron complex outermembrane receptor protein